MFGTGAIGRSHESVLSVKSLGAHDYESLWEEPTGKRSGGSLKPLAAALASVRSSLSAPGLISRSTSLANAVCALVANIISIAGFVNLLILLSPGVSMFAPAAAMLFPILFTAALALLELTSALRSTSLLIRESQQRSQSADWQKVTYLDELLRDPEAARWNLQHYVQLLRSTVLRRLGNKKNASSRPGPLRHTGARRRWGATLAALASSVASAAYLQANLDEVTLPSRETVTRLICSDAVKSWIAHLDICSIGSEALAHIFPTGVDSSLPKTLMVATVVLLPVLQWFRLLLSSGLFGPLVPPVVPSLAFAAAGFAPEGDWGGWRDEPDPALGLVVTHVSTFSTSSPSRKVSLRDISFSCRPGQITVICGSLESSGRSDVANMLYHGYRREELGRSPGVISYGGRALTDWCKETYQAKVVYLKGGEEQDFELQAGVVAGALPSASADDLARHYAAAEATGAGAILQRLGPGTLLSSSPALLSRAEWKCLSACRALSACSESKAVLLLDGITDACSESSEAKIFHLLREFLKENPKRVVIVMATRMATARLGDSCIVLGKGSVLEEGSWDRVSSRASVVSVPITTTTSTLIG